MSTITIIRCDGPECNNSEEMNAHIAASMHHKPDGWYLLVGRFGEESRHFCTLACVQDFATLEVARREKEPFTLENKP